MLQGHQGFCSPTLLRAQELEADEAAAHALAGAGIPSGQWAAGLSLLTEDARAPEWRLEEQAQVSGLAARESAASGVCVRNLRLRFCCQACRSPPCWMYCSHTHPVLPCISAQGEWVVRLRVHDEQEAAFVEQAKSLLALLHAALIEQGPRQPAPAGPAASSLHAEHDRVSQSTPGLPRQQRLRRRYLSSGNGSSAALRHSAAAAFQQRLGWDVPPSWFEGLPPGVQAAAVLTLLDSHPPTALREARLRELAVAMGHGSKPPA